MMNPIWALNRSYFISPTSSVHHVLEDLVASGIHVNGTREVLNARVIFSNLGCSDDFTWKSMGANIFEVNALRRAISSRDNSFISATYESKYYTFLYDAIKSVREQFTVDCVETRRAVIQFPEMHCFESIQIIVRGKHLIITTNMRSCNAYKNLMNDAYLAYRVAQKVVAGFGIEECTMTMNIGSLHIFEEDVDNVL